MKISRSHLRRLIKEEIEELDQATGESKEENSAEVQYWKSLFQDLYDDGGKSYPALDPGTPVEDLEKWARGFAYNELTIQDFSRLSRSGRLKKHPDFSREDIRDAVKDGSEPWPGGVEISETNGQAVIDFLVRLQQGYEQLGALGF